MKPFARFSSMKSFAVLSCTGPCRNNAPRLGTNPGFKSIAWSYFVLDGRVPTSRSEKTVLRYLWNCFGTISSVGFCFFFSSSRAKSREWDIRLFIHVSCASSVSFPVITEISDNQ